MFIPAYRDRLRTSVLRHSADACVGYLIHHQYCPATIRAYLHSIEHFARWVSGLHIPLSSIDESFTHRFVTEHLSECRCPAPCQCSINSVRPALAHLLHVLREEGNLSGPRSFPPLVQEELERFDIHLDSVCGVAANTRVSRRQWVGKFLTDQFGSAPVDIPPDPLQRHRGVHSPTHESLPDRYTGRSRQRVAQLPAFPCCELRGQGRGVADRGSHCCQVAPGYRTQAFDNRRSRRTSRRD
jgi:hypothetical protein